MKIETVFDVGDRVWFEPLIEEIPVCGVIEGLRIKVDRRFKVECLYCLHYNGVSYEYSKDAIFPTKEELLKSL